MLEILVRGQVKGALHLCYFVFFLAKSAKVATEQIEVTKWEDTVSSPNFPQTYPTNSNISWIISVSSGNRIEIHIFSVQTQCDGDYLQIRDGKSMTSPLVGRYCGNNYGPFPVITSSGTYVLLQFVSDNTTDGNHLSGFTLLHTGLCHLHLNSTNGVITTPNHPNQYPNFLDCLWMIQLHPSVFINVECHDFALEQKEGCVFDYMEVLAGVSSDAPVIGRYCGIHNETLIFARQGNISIKFVSDKDKEFGGFRCTYKVGKDYSTSSMVKRTVSGERGLFTTTAPTLSSVTKHSSFRENHGTMKRTETRNDFNSIRVTTGSRYHQITSTTNKHHYETIPLSSGITASYSFTGNNWKSTMSAAVVIAVNTDDFETSDHPLSLLSGVNVSSSYETNAWKNTRATGILTGDKLNTSTPFSNSVMKSTPKTPFFALSTLTSSPVYSINSSLWHHSSDMYSSPFTASRTRMVSFDSTDSHQRHRASVTYHTHTASSSTTVPPSPPPEGDTQSVLPFPWHLIPFMVIIFILIVIFIAHYLRIADIIDAIILILKDKKRKEKASKKEKRNLDMIKGNFSTAGFKASTFHSYQRELFYEDALNFSLFENTKAIEFSIQLDEEHQSSESRESVEIACVMGEESRDTKPLSDSLSEMFDPVETH